MNYDAVPQALKERPQWVTWRFEKEGEPVSKDTEGATKVPYNARTGHKASSTNERTWTPYGVAVQATGKHQHDGIGFMFSENDPYTGIDLDDCIDQAGSMAVWAREIVDAMASYTEISPSGSGVKIWVEGEIPSSVKTPQIEMYFKARYFTVTGRHLTDTPTTIRNVNGALSRLYESVKKEDLAPVPTPRATIGNEHATQWAHKKLADAIRMVTLAPDGIKHDTLIDAGRLAGGVVPHISESEIETALFAAIEGRAADKHAARKTIRDGIRMGISAPLPIPPPPAQPHFDAEDYACCPTHHNRLNPSKNGNGYKCRERDASTASGWCDFWWKGEGYIVPQSEAVAGEIISQTPITIAQPTSRFTLYNLRGLRALPPVTWLIDGEVPAGLTTLICGASEAGKSFLAIDYSLQIARKYPDRSVVYIAPEGGSGYRQRVDAWLDYYGGTEPDNLFFILQSVTILNPQTLGELIATIRTFNPIMVVIDTLARTLVGGDENSAKDVGMFFYHTDIIREQTHAAILVVHHTGKAGNYRGSSALLGSVDSWIDFSNDDGLITIACGKAKDWERFAPRYLRMVKSADSVVLLPSDQVTQRDNTLTEGQRKILETLALDIFSEAGARRSELVSATGINDLTIFKVLSRLKKNGFINQSKKGDPYFISTDGLATIKSYHRDLRRKRDADKLASEGSLPDAQLANSQPTSNEVATSSPNQLATSYNLPSIREGKLATSSGASSASESEELFPEETITQTAIVEPPVIRPAMELDWDYLRKAYAAQNVAGIRSHCSMRRISSDEVLEQLFAETGAPEVDDDE